MDIVILHNEPTLPRDSPDWASEAGVLASVEAVSDALSGRGHRVRRLGLRSPDELQDLFARLAGAEVVFNLFEGFEGVGRGEAEVTGLVELLGYAVTGSPAATLALARDKVRTKRLLAGAGVCTPEFELVAADEPIERQRFDELLSAGPLFIKPAHEDGSLGIGEQSIVTEFDALQRQVEGIRDRYGDVLVERFIVGREFNAAIVDFGSPEPLPLAEIDFCGDGPRGWQVVTYDAKWAAGSVADLTTPGRCPAQVDSRTSARIGELALAAFKHLGCRDYARVDVRMDDTGRVLVLEVNTNPDLDPTAGFARQLRAAGTGYEAFTNRVVEHALARPHVTHPRAGTAPGSARPAS